MKEASIIVGSGLLLIAVVPVLKVGAVALAGFLFCKEYARG